MLQVASGSACAWAGRPVAGLPGPVLQCPATATGSGVSPRPPRLRLSSARVVQLTRAHRCRCGVHAQAAAVAHDDRVPRGRATLSLPLAVPQCWTLLVQVVESEAKRHVFLRFETRSLAVARCCAGSVPLATRAPCQCLPVPASVRGMEPIGADTSGCVVRMATLVKWADARVDCVTAAAGNDSSPSPPPPPTPRPSPCASRMALRWHQWVSDSTCRAHVAVTLDREQIHTYIR